MSAITITSWNIGLRKISLTKLLQVEAGLSRGAAKGLVDSLLEGQRPIVELPPGRDVQAVAAAIRELGAGCEVRDD